MRRRKMIGMHPASMLIPASAAAADTWEQRDYAAFGVARATPEAYVARGENVNALP